MSEFVFKLPDLGEGTVESEIGEWFIKVGDQIAEEDVIGTMMTDKAAVELSSPVSGTVVRLAGDPGDIVAVGAELVIIETDAGSAAEAPAEVEVAASEITEAAVAAPAVQAEPGESGHVALRHHAKIAVAGFGRVHKMCWRTGRR